MRAFKIEVNGVSHHGTWIALADGRVEVRSAYGATFALEGDQDPAEVARQVLTTLIEARFGDRRQGAARARL